MKRLLLVLLPLILTFSCEDDTPTNDDVDDMMSLDWILLKKGVDTEFFVESCDGYENCFCNGFSNECGDCIWETKDGDDYYLYEYKLYWNKDLSVCNDWNCDEEDLGNYDIVIPSHIPFSVREEGCDCVDNPFTFHPNCYNPLDTTMVLNGKNVSIEKMGGISRDYDGNLDTGGSSGYIHYYPLDNYLILTGRDTYNIDLNNFTIVDFQRKE